MADSWQYAIYAVDFDGSSEATFAADHIFSKYQPASPFRTNQGVRIVALERKDLEENVDGKRQTLSNALVDIIKEDEKNGLVSKGQNVSFAGGYDADERASAPCDQLQCCHQCLCARRLVAVGIGACSARCLA